MKNDKQDKVELIGVYEIEESVHLVECIIDAHHSDFDISQFTQKIAEDPLSNQVAYDEKFLNATGSEVTGDGLNPKSFSSHETRIAFFLHFLDPAFPLSTPFGEVEIPECTKVPERIDTIISYKNP